MVWRSPKPLDIFIAQFDAAVRTMGAELIEMLVASNTIVETLDGPLKYS